MSLELDKCRSAERGVVLIGGGVFSKITSRGFRGFCEFLKKTGFYSDLRGALSLFHLVVSVVLMVSGVKMTGPFLNNAPEKGVFWKRGLFRKVNFLEILENPRLWKTKENPTIL